MSNNQLKITIKGIRSISNADIFLNGITIITGENGSGKSTISKLTFCITNTSIDYDNIIDSQIKSDLRSVYWTVNQLTRDLSYFLEKNEYLKIRNAFKKIYREDSQLELFEEDNTILLAIDFLIEKFNSITFDQNKPLYERRIERIKRILEDLLTPNKIEKDLSLIELLVKLKSVVNKSINKGIKLKETRPDNILDTTLDETFYDSSIPKSFNLYEYGIPIIDRENKKITPIHSIKNVAYIDTPMVVGLNFIGDRPHWQNLNELLTRKSTHTFSKRIESIINETVIKGNAKFVEDDFLNETFIYKRSDGKEFNLLECATGLKSFAILQILLKNGFLNNKTLLIIDEPEVHLHPQWVVEYARLVVLLNKFVGVKFLIASHHPDMISAIKYISEKEDVSSNLNFYLAYKNNENEYLYDYKNLELDIEPIFTSFNIALERIDLYGKTE